MKKLNFEDFSKNQLIRIQKTNIVGGQPPVKYFLDENDESQPVSQNSAGSPFDPSDPEFRQTNP